MLYEIEVYEVDGPQAGDVARFQHYVVEAPDYKMTNGEVDLPIDLIRFHQQRAHEASVMWGFAQVDVRLSRLFPAQVGIIPGAFVNQCSSVLDEWTYVCPKEASV